MAKRILPFFFSIATLLALPAFGATHDTNVRSCFAILSQLSDRLESRSPRELVAIRAFEFWQKVFEVYWQDPINIRSAELNQIEYPYALDRTAAYKDVVDTFDELRLALSNGHLSFYEAKFLPSKKNDLKDQHKMTALNRLKNEMPGLRAIDQKEIVDTTNRILQKLNAVQTLMESLLRLDRATAADIYSILVATGYDGITGDQVFRGGKVPLSWGGKNLLEYATQVAEANIQNIDLLSQLERSVDKLHTVLSGKASYFSPFNLTFIVPGELTFEDFYWVRALPVLYEGFVTSESLLYADQRTMTRRQFRNHDKAHNRVINKADQDQLYSLEQAFMDAETIEAKREVLSELAKRVRARLIFLLRLQRKSNKLSLAAQKMFYSATFFPIHEAPMPLSRKNFFARMGGFNERRFVVGDMGELPADIDVSAVRQEYESMSYYH